MKDSRLAEKFAKVRQDFPALEQKINGHNLVYLDSGATTLKPRSVVERITNFYLYEAANVHRGAHSLSDQATSNFEAAREKVRSFIKAASTDEIVFVRGTTDGINLVAQSYLLEKLKPNDVILVTEMEHHANIVPWQMVAEKKQASVQAVKVTTLGELDYADLAEKLKQSVKLVAVTACSNTLGTIIDVEKVCRLAHAAGAKVLVDGAQIVAQLPVDVQKMDCDFFVFSAHKIFGPFGFGILYGRREILESMPPYQGGGSMIAQVSIEKTTYNTIPFRFEAGTPHIEGAIALHAALNYVESIGFADIYEWEHALLTEATRRLLEIPEIRIIGQAKDKAAILSFNLAGAHHSDVAQIFDQLGVAVRAGHHCTQPLLVRMGITGSVRASFSVYNDFEDIETLVQAVCKARELLL